MFKMNEERADIMRNRDEYLNREDNNCGYIIVSLDNTSVVSLT